MMPLYPPVDMEMDRTALGVCQAQRMPETQGFTVGPSSSMQEGERNERVGHCSLNHMLADLFILKYCGIHVALVHLPTCLKAPTKQRQGRESPLVGVTPESQARQGEGESCVCKSSSHSHPITQLQVGQSENDGSCIALFLSLACWEGRKAYNWIPL